MALALAAGPAAAVAAPFFNLTGGPSSAIAANNDFKGQLATLGMKYYSDSRNVVLAGGTGRVSFAFLGSESGYTNYFKIGTTTYAEADSNRFANPFVFHTGIYNAGSFKPSFLTLSPAGTGSPGNNTGFGIFIPNSTGPRAPGNGAIRATTVYFGFDDRTAHPDRDFDDMIVRATVSAVPEPAIWGTMILGFGVIGSALRRRVSRSASRRLALA